MILAKVLLKVLDETKDRTRWVHLCYVDEVLYKTFLEKFNCDRVDIADYILKWSKNDFNIDLSMTTRKDIAILKALIKDRYSRAHPHMFLSGGETDRQGWVRVWLSDQMERELKKYAR